MSAEQDATLAQPAAAPSPEAAAPVAAQPDAVLEASPAPVHHDADALATGDSEAAAVERPSQRIQIGSQRDAEGESTPPPPQPKPVNPGPARADRPPTESKKKPYPPPNIRSQLSPELQQEMDAAL